MKPFKIQQRNKVLDRSDKLDLAIEITFFMLLIGAIISQLLMSLFIHRYGGFFPNLERFIVSTISLLFYEFPALLAFGFSFRITIFLLDIINIDNQFRLIIGIVVGTLLILYIQDLYLDFELLFHNKEFSKLIIYPISYIPPFIYWFIYRNIWSELINVNHVKESDILDDFEF